MADQEAADLESQFKLLDLTKFNSVSDKGGELIMVHQYIRVLHYRREKGRIDCSVQTSTQ